MNRSVKEMQVTTKTDVFAFGVVVAELITGQHALIRDNREPKRMKSLVSVVSRPLDFYYRETKQNKTDQLKNVWYQRHDLYWQKHVNQRYGVFDPMKSL